MLQAMSNFPDSTHTTDLMVPVRHDTHNKRDSMPITSGIGKHHKAFLASNNFGEKDNSAEKFTQSSFLQLLREQAPL